MFERYFRAGEAIAEVSRRHPETHPLTTANPGPTIRGDLNMMTVGPDGNLYVSADSICPATGIPGLCPERGSLVKITVPSDDNNNKNDG